ncbi:MAG: 4Fe-4S cluster-binding domain-containing protein [Candidatus Omnitrophica bacterium]|nr:4Fe-4S cluster-binding domain-containing protein [Candidatus Omnitrophota bacterium]
MGIKDSIPQTVKDTLKLIRISRPVTAILGTPYPRPDHRTLQLDITYECNLSCPSCNRSCPQAVAEGRMTIEQIERFIEESVNNRREWKQLKIMGGEPVLHPEFFEIMDLLRDWKNKHYREAEICIKTNGEGVQVNRVLDKVPRDVVIRRSPKEYVLENFYGYNIASEDLPLYRTLADFSVGCLIPHNCGIGLNRYGYYVCGNGAGVARVFGIDTARMKMPDEKDRMRDQTSRLCRYCGAFHHFISIARPRDPFTVTESWKEAFERYNVKPPELPEWG